MNSIPSNRTSTAIDDGSPAMAITAQDVNTPPIITVPVVEKADDIQLASFLDLLSFLKCTESKVLFGIGCVSAALHGLFHVAMAFAISRGFANMSEGSLDNTKQAATTFLMVGIFSFTVGTIQIYCLEEASRLASVHFRLMYFRSYLNQDAAFSEIFYVSQTDFSQKPYDLRKALGSRLGEGLSGTVTIVSGFVFAFWSSWQMTLAVTLLAFPLLSVSGTYLLRLNQTQSATALNAYKVANKKAKEFLEQIKTVKTANGEAEAIHQYSSAADQACTESSQHFWKLGFANGAIYVSQALFPFIISTYGAYLISNQVEEDGCDPTGMIVSNKTCNLSSVNVLAAMLSVAYAAWGLSQMSNALDSIAIARSVCFPAISMMRRSRGSRLGQERMVEIRLDQLEGTSKRRNGSINRNLLRIWNSIRRSSVRTNMSNFDEERSNYVLAKLPPFQIDPLSNDGISPSHGDIHFSNVTFAYPTKPNTPVLSEFNLTIPKNKTIAIVGPSGCGKSTVASLIQRIYDCHAGDVMINGMNLKDLNISQYRQMIGVVSQEPSLFASTIGENIAIGLPNATKEMIEQAACMANCDFINTLPQKYDTDLGDMGDQLSGGQKQRIAIARVLLQRPKIVILDEATSALDHQSQKSVQDALKTLIIERKEQTTIIIAHRLETIENADEIVCMMNGEIVERGSHQVLMEHDDMYKAFVEKSKVKPTSTYENEQDDVAPMPRSKLIHVPESDQTNDDYGDIENVPSYNKYLKGSTKEVISFKNVTFSYPSRPERKILDGLSLSINKGEVLALVGNSGGGKSTIATLMMDLYQPENGEITYNDNGKYLMSRAERSEFRKEIGFINQEPYLFDDTIANNISFGVQGASIDEIRRAASLAQAHEFITALPNGYDNRVGQNGSLLSGGQKQRIAIARALIRKPKVLIVDEATSALDPLLSQGIQETLEGICHDNKDTALVIITHNLDSIQNASKIALISDGKVMEYGTHKELMGQLDSKYRTFYGRKNIQSYKTDDISGNGNTRVIVDKKERLVKENTSANRSILPLFKEDINWGYILLGSIGALLAGFAATFTGMLSGLTMDILFKPLLPCNESSVESLCEEYWEIYAEEMVRKSLDLLWYWSGRLICLLIGYMFLFVGFGRASEQMKKRLRVKLFRCLCEKELAFHNKHSVSDLVKMLEEDMRKIDDLFDQPLRMFMLTIGSVVSGMIICYYYMWPLALLSTLMTPLMVMSVFFNKAFGEDEGANGEKLSSSDAIAMETVMKKKTISSFCLEKRQYQKYATCVYSNSDRSDVTRAASEAFAFAFRHGFGVALQFFVGGLILARYPQFTFRDFAITVQSFSFIFVALDISGMASDRKEATLAIQRIRRFL